MYFYESAISEQEANAAEERFSVKQNPFGYSVRLQPNYEDFTDLLSMDEVLLGLVEALEEGCVVAIGEVQ